MPLCVGNFPQLMRDFHQVLIEPKLGEIDREAGRPAAVDLSAFVAKADKPAEILIALGTLRLARQFDAAQAFVGTHNASSPPNGAAAGKTKAALAWHAGRCGERGRCGTHWLQAHPVQFNRGMSALFAKEIAAAKQHLNAAVTQLPAASAWHHLGRLYLTLAEIGV